MIQSVHKDFEREITCTYSGETYSVRDNGEVLRHHRKGARKRHLDEKWIFGNESKTHGYMYISSTVVHRIVATAFHGPQPSKEYVVDHIDTNRRNNRPENLRWITRLDNILQNPITRRRIEIAYGSIENFINNPKLPLHGKLDPNFDWMRSVTKIEAKESYERLLYWAKQESIPSKGRLGEWIYTSQNEQSGERPEPDNLFDSRTHGAIQKNWKTPNEFPLCPSDIGANALNDYHQMLKEGELFARNNYGTSKVVSAELSEDAGKLLVLGINSGGVKDWSLSRVSVEDKLFVHESLGMFFSLEGARKQFTIERGLEWKGGETIDDYS